MAKQADAGYVGNFLAAVFACEQPEHVAGAQQ
jgi:hypothetical protein